MPIIILQDIQKILNLVIDQRIARLVERIVLGDVIGAPSVCQVCGGKPTHQHLMVSDSTLDYNQSCEDSLRAGSPTSAAHAACVTIEKCNGSKRDMIDAIEVYRRNAVVRFVIPVPTAKSAAKVYVRYQKCPIHRGAFWPTRHGSLV